MLAAITEYLTTKVNQFDESLHDTPAHTIVFATAALYFLYNQFHNPWLARAIRARHNQTSKQVAIDFAYELAKHVPQVQTYLQQELEKNLHSTKEKLAAQRQGNRILN